MATATQPSLFDLVIPIKDCEWSQFVKARGRVPLIEDARKPWTYRGWLAYYLMLSDTHPDATGRWTYWFRCMEAGRILADPIPQVRFGPTGGVDRTTAYKQLDVIINRLANQVTSPVQTFLDWLLWGFGLNKAVPALAEDVQEFLYRTFNLGPFLLEPYDYFGSWIAGHKGSWNPNAFFPTPHEVVDFMVQMNFTGIPQEVSRSQTVCDPCVGTGRMLLHASNYSLRLYGCDIDPQMVDVSRINGALYVPWLVRPFPDHFFGTKKTPCGLEVRDSIRHPLLESKS